MDWVLGQPPGTAYSGALGGSGPAGKQVEGVAGGWEKWAEIWTAVFDVRRVTMRKPKREDEEEPAHFFGEDFESDDFADGDDDNNGKGDSRRKRPARERVELRNEQQMLRR